MTDPIADHAEETGHKIKAVCECGMEWGEEGKLLTMPEESLVSETDNDTCVHPRNFTAELAVATHQAERALKPSRKQTPALAGLPDGD